MESLSATDALQRLLDIEQIKSLKARYCRYIDTKQWEAMYTLFCADACFNGFGSAPPGADVSTFIKGVSTRLRDTISIHHCHMPEIRFQGRDLARGVWAMMDYVEWPAGTAPKEVPDSRGFYGYGHYEEEYRRESDAWRIAHMRLTRLRFDALPADHPAARMGILQACREWLEFP